MRLEQTIRSTMTEAMDMDGRLDQLVRAGLMPTSSLPLLKRAISRMHAGMSLQGAERDVMNMFISSMMFIVLGDDTVFNKARAGAKSYAAEEVELDENAPIVAHLTKRYGDNIRKSHVMSAAKDFGVDPSKLSKAVRKKLGKSMLDEAKEKTEYDYEGDMAMGQLKSIIANSQRMHDMLSEDTNLPEWVQSKITLAEDYITTAIDNIVINAMQYCTNGKIIIKLYKNEQEEVVFKVQDEGIGIPKEELYDVFGAFTVSSKTKTPAGGRGVGLALSKKVIDLHNGRIWAKQNPDKGVTIGFNLPLKN